MKRLALALITLFALTSTALASPPELPAECAASYPERLVDAQHAITEQAVYMAEWGRVMPWFDQHCRFLTELERAVRKIDDPAAFVCDTRKGRPAELTSTFVAEHSGPADVVLFQEIVGDNDRCAPFDVAEGRPPLVLRDPTPAQTLAVICYASARPSCVEARKAIEAATARAGS
jgi:hypothetical protein